MNRLNISLIIAIAAVLLIAGGYAAYSGTTGNSQPQLQATGENCTGVNCIQNQNCENKINCTQNCTTDQKQTHQRNRNCVNKN